MVNKTVYIKMISGLLGLLLLCNILSIRVCAAGKETYILVEKASEAMQIMEKYGNQGAVNNTEEAQDDAAEQEKLNLSEFLTITYVGTRTENTETKKVSGDKTTTEATAETPTETPTKTTTAITQELQVFSVKSSKPASEWPAKLKTIRAIADKNAKGEFTAQLVEETPANSTKLGYLISSTLDRTGCFYKDSKNNIYVFFTEISEDDAKNYLEDETTDHKAMEGQVELRELSAEELANLTKIRDELAREQEHSIDKALISIADIILNIFGILCILYGVVLLVAYVMDMYNILSIELEFFNIVTFGRWHIADLADNSIIQDMTQFINIPKLIVIVGLTVLFGVILIVVDWVTLAATIYTYLRERG